MLTEGGSAFEGIGEGGFTIPGMEEDSNAPQFQTADELTSSLSELADFLTGLQDRTGPETFLGSLQAAPEAYATAFENFGTALMGLAEGGGGGGADPQAEFMLVAEAFIAAGDAVLAAAAREVGEDENDGSESGVVFAVDALVTALDEAGAAISNAFQDGSIGVLGAAVGRFVTEIENAMMGGEPNPDEDTPGEMVADMIADGAATLAGGVDMAFNALTGEEGALGQVATAILDNYPDIENAIQEGAGDLATAIMGDDSEPSPLDGLTDMLMNNPIADAIGDQEDAPGAEDLTALLMNNPIADAIGDQEDAPGAEDLTALLMNNPIADAIGDQEDAPSAEDLTALLMNNPIADAIGDQEDAPSAEDLTALLMNNPIADAIGDQEDAPGAEDLMAVGGAFAEAISTQNPTPVVEALSAFAPA